MIQYLKIYKDKLINWIWGSVDENKEMGIWKQKEEISLISIPRNCRLVRRATETVEKFNYKSYNEFHSLLINHGKTSLCHDAATESLIINFLPANSQITTISGQ